MGDDRVWVGAAALEPLLVPINHLERHPRNPRRGEVEMIRESLRRFGQVRPILTDGRHIIAGNHTWLAAVAEGWTHVAAVPNDFATAEEAVGYLLADNRLPELGAYDGDAKRLVLEEIERSGAWEGTGYTSDDLEDLRALHGQIQPMEREPFNGGYGATEAELEARRQQLAGGRTLAEVPMLLTREQSVAFDADCAVLRKRYAPEGGVTETVFAAVAAVAKRLNQGS